MNGSYYPDPTFQGNANKRQESIYNGINNTNGLTMEQSYIENILRSNIGKNATLYFSYPDARDWTNKIYRGTIMQAGRDHLIINDTLNSKWFLLKIIYLDYVEFDDKINYSL